MRIGRLVLYVLFGYLWNDVFLYFGWFFKLFDRFHSNFNDWISADWIEWMMASINWNQINLSDEFYRMETEASSSRQWRPAVDDIEFKWIKWVLLRVIPTIHLISLENINHSASIQRQINMSNPRMQWNGETSNRTNDALVINHWYFFFIYLYMYKCGGIVAYFFVLLHFTSTLVSSLVSFIESTPLRDDICDTHRTISVCCCRCCCSMGGWGR